MIQRGDVVIVTFPYVSGSGGKVRPAVVVQNDRDNSRIQNTVVGMITGNTAYASAEPTQLLIDPSTPEGALSGLNYPSAVKCLNLYTVRQQDIRATVGRLSPTLIAQMNDCLKAALDL